MKVSNRTFIITGGSSGLGLATAHLLLTLGANVSIFDLNPPPAASSSSFSSLLNSPSRTIFTKTDVSSTPSITAALTSTLAWIKSTNSALGGIVCCAGISLGEKALPRQPAQPTLSTLKLMDLSKFDRVISINLRGTVDVIRQTLPHLSFNEPEGPDGERGVIIIVSSVAAYEGQVGQLAYSASKGALRSLVLPLAREVGPQAGIRVMGIAPGVFETPMSTGGRSGAGSAPPPAQAQPKSDGVDTTNKAPIEKELKEKQKSTAKSISVNRDMVSYPVRMGKADEFARLAREIIENPMLNGSVIRLDGAVRLPSRI